MSADFDHRQLLGHIASCPSCQLAAHQRRACPVGRQLHETAVRSAQREWYARNG